ncbi:transposase [Bacillus amyloliquefaciens]|uniref:transposase n=1 Tax=Bacillus amyloliquefaciens TaxID=1390 RepID=UPI003342DE91
MFPKLKFHYDSEQDRSICLNHQTLTYAATDRKGYRSYKSNPEICSACPFSNNAQDQRTTKRSSPDMYGRMIKKRSDKIVCLFQEKTSAKKEKIERSFADSKQMLRYCWLGKQNVREQVLLTAACQNMKKIAAYLAKACGSAFSAPEIK